MRNLNYGFEGGTPFPQVSFKETLMDKWLKRWQRIKSAIWLEIGLMINQPKNYVYLAFLSNSEKVHFFPYDENWKLVGEKVITKIKKAAPRLKVLFIGSAKLGVLGEKDIDLFIEISNKNFELYKQTLTKLFGEPKKIRRLFIEWQFMVDDCNVEVSLVDPREQNFQRSVKVFQSLEKNGQLLKAYEDLKIQLNKTSVRNYIHKRMRFFHQILKGTI